MNGPDYEAMIAAEAAKFEAACGVGPARGEGALVPAGQAQGGKPCRKLALENLADIMREQYPKDCIDGVYPETGVAVLGGGSGDGKSFIALDQMFHLALGWPWFGRRVRQRPVLYLYLEAGEGLRKRVEAWQIVNERIIDESVPVQFCRRGVDLLRDAEAIASSMPENALLFVDTMRAAARGVDENGPEGMGRILAAVDRIRELRPQSLIILLHHVPKAGGKSAADRNRLAGWSGLPACVDAVIATKREGDERALYIAKARDSTDGTGFAYRLKIVKVGEDDEGRAVFSGAIVPDGKPKQKTKLTRREERALEAFIEAQVRNEQAEISYGQWKDALFALADPDERKGTTGQAFKEGHKGLIQKGIITRNGEAFILADREDC
ncbi:MAG: AAA family ATPase [Desulfovibrio sp.]|nr:AAA family ATPase [Desulfovibrio sp.]